MINETKYEHLKVEMKEEKRKMHKELVKEHKWFFRLMDAMMVCIILFNFGAASLTNIMVTKTNAEEVEMGIAEPIVLKEVNPIASQVGAYEIHPDAKMLYTQLIFMGIAWAIMILAYFYYRATVYTNLGLIVLFAGMLFYFMLLGWDFFNDLGYLIGFKYFV